jgi:hypothetical protein
MRKSPIRALMKGDFIMAKNWNLNTTFSESLS